MVESAFPIMHSSTIDFIILMTQVFNKNHTELFERGHGNNGVQGEVLSAEFFFAFLWCVWAQNW